MNSTPLFRLSLALVGLVTAAACGGSSAPDNLTSSSGTGASTGSAATSGSTSGSTSGNPTGGTSGSAAGGTSSSSGGSFTEGPFPTPPQVVNVSGNGPVKSSPKLHAVFFSGDDTTQTAALGDFTTKLGATDYWATVSEYGVGAATGDVIQLTEAAAASYTDSTMGSPATGSVGAWLADKFTSDPTDFPTPTADDLYIIYFPASTTITLDGQASCTVFGGYHLETAVNNQAVTYAVVPRCTLTGMSTLESTTSSASHEIVEGTTDPFPLSNPAFLYPDDTHFDWLAAVGGGEVADLCAQNPQSFYTFTEFPYMVQRVWSNKAAKAGHDPCQPAIPGAVYANAAPVFTSTVQYNVENSGMDFAVPGINIPVGSTATVPIEFFTDGPTDDFTVVAYDYEYLISQGQTKYLDVSVTSGTGNNGSKGSVSITVNAAGQDNEELFIIMTPAINASSFNWWFGAVTNN